MLRRQIALAWRTDRLQRVRIQDIVQIAIRDQQIFKAVKIDIQENRTPRPFSCLNAAQLRDFSIRVISSIEIQRIP